MLYSFMAFAGNIRRMFNMTAKMAAIFTYTYTSTVNLLSPRLFHFHLIHTFPLFSLCVCVYPPPPPSSFSLADCRCVNTCWKEVWQWARRWMQSRLVNNALWHSSVGECSVFCSALTPPPQKNVLFLPHPLDLDHVLSLAFVLSAWYLSIIIFMHWPPPPPPCLQPFWLLRSVLPERTAQACQRWFILQLLAHANQFSCLCFDPLFAFFPPLSLYLLYKQVSFVCSCFFAKLTPSSCQSVCLSFFKIAVSSVISFIWIPENACENAIIVSVFWIHSRAI